MAKRWWDVLVTADEDELRQYAVLADGPAEARGIAIGRATGLIDATAVPMEGFDPELDGDHYDAIIDADEED